MPKNILLQKIGNIHTSEILGSNNGCMKCGENKVDIKYSKSRKYSKSSQLFNITIIVLIITSLLLANNKFISTHIISNKFINKILSIKDYFVNK